MQEVDEARQTKSEAHYFDLLNHYIPGLELLLSEHEKDSVSDHNLKLQHTRETSTLQEQLQTLRTLRDALVAQGYRVSKVKPTFAQEIEVDRLNQQEAQRRREKQERFERICTNCVIAGIAVAVLGGLIAVLASSGYPLILTLVGGAVAIVSNWLKEL